MQLRGRRLNQNKAGTPNLPHTSGTRGGEIPSEEQVLSIRKPDHNQFGSEDTRSAKSSADIVEGAVPWKTWKQAGPD